MPECFGYALHEIFKLFDAFTPKVYSRIMVKLNDFMGSMSKTLGWRYSCFSYLLFSVFSLSALSIFSALCLWMYTNFEMTFAHIFSVVWFQCRSSFFFFCFIEWAILVLDLAQCVRRSFSLNKYSTFNFIGFCSPSDMRLLYIKYISCVCVPLFYHFCIIFVYVFFLALRSCFRHIVNKMFKTLSINKSIHIYNLHGTYKNALRGFYERNCALMQFKRITHSALCEHGQCQRQTNAKLTPQHWIRIKIWWIKCDLLLLDDATFQIIGPSSVCSHFLCYLHLFLLFINKICCVLCKHILYFFFCIKISIAWCSFFDLIFVWFSVWWQFRLHFITNYFTINFRRTMAMSDSFQYQFVIILAVMARKIVKNSKFIFLWRNKWKHDCNSSNYVQRINIAPKWYGRQKCVFYSLPPFFIAISHSFSNFFHAFLIRLLMLEFFILSNSLGVFPCKKSVIY